MYMETSKQMAIKTFLVKIGQNSECNKKKQCFSLPNQSPVIKITAFHIFNKNLWQHNLKVNIFFSLTLLTTTVTQVCYSYGNSY